MPDGKFNDVNERLCEMTGYSREELLRMSPMELTHPDDRDYDDRLQKAYWSGQSPDYQVEKRYVRKDGRVFWVQVSASMARDATGTPLRSAGIIRDITERKRAEEELRRSGDELDMRVQVRTAELAKANEALRHLSSRLLSTQEEERRRIAGEIHDTLGACLNAIRFKVEDSLQKKETAFEGKASESFTSVLPLVQEGIEECRRMQQDLRPSILDDLGLLATLPWFSRRFQTIYSTIRIEQEIDITEDELPDALKIVIYRVLQEAMNNIAKHSRAESVHLSLRKGNGRIELTIRDNGQGFDLEKIGSQESTKRGLGLTSMRERVELSGGSFGVESAEGKGTVIRASWPLSESC